MTLVDDDDDDDGCEKFCKVWFRFDDVLNFGFDECVVCWYILYLFGVGCLCDETRKACLRYVNDLCKCVMLKKMMFYREIVVDLESLVKKMEKVFF